MLAPIKATATKESVLVHAGSPRLSATLAEPLRQSAIAPLMVKRVWIWQGAERHPHAGLAPDLITDTSEEGAEDRRKGDCIADDRW